MGGTVHGIVNRSFYTPTAATMSRYFFSMVAEFFDHLCTAEGGSYMERIASFYNGGSGLSATADDGSWGVWRLKESTARPGDGLTGWGDIYLWLAVNHSTNPANYYIRNDATAPECTGVAVCARVDGANPWLGTSNDDGLDSAANPVWNLASADGGYMPLSNEDGRPHATNRNNLACLYRGYYNKVYTLHCLADADTIMIICSDHTSADRLRYCYFWFSLVEQIPSYAAVSPNPFMWCCGNSTSSTNDDMPGDYPFGITAFGTANGDSWDKEGSFVRTPGGTWRAFKLRANVTVLGDGTQPGYLTANGNANAYDEFPIIVCDYSSPLNPGGLLRVPGEQALIRAVCNTTNESYDPVRQRACFGSTAADTYKLTFPWPTAIGEAPGQTRTFDGVVF